MKAIIFEDVNGIKNFLVFSDKKAFDIFNKICQSCGYNFCTSEKDFEKLKDSYDMWTEFVYKRFLGIGIYDYDGNFHHKLIDNESSCYCWIEDYFEQTNEIKISNKIKLEQLFLN